ncbi:hypothetical protein [Candidatus Berkiella aquae]|uniref:Uncharacterized protein n=1 Tax=Candidatus Berkiella aquae TaxID=295108 RepID=A0AAE3HWF3_9GAMM|nr:hypothetical protein [Candidatus Berkiella aquae]MCS5711503.1 hypothetical protein [Candidatus Berkiella aquae]
MRTSFFMIVMQGAAFSQTYLLDATQDKVINFYTQVANYKKQAARSRLNQQSGYAR